MARQKPITLLKFQTQFNSEDACREHLYKLRWADGFVCPKCGVVDEPFNIKSRKLLQCRHCNHQTSVTAGTVMDKTRIPLRKWFWAMFLMSSDKRGCSATQLATELELSYSSAWYLCHRIRSAMGERDAHYLLSGYIEVDDAFFGAPTSNGKRGRGTEKSVVLVGLSLSGKGCPQFAKMQVVPDVKGTTITEFADVSIEPGAVVGSDGYSSYNALSEKGFAHEGKTYDPIGDPEHLRWLHIVISNAKAYIAGTYHGLRKKHLQRYLDEFCYRLNRRAFRSQQFNRTLFACAVSSNLTYHELTR